MFLDVQSRGGLLRSCYWLWRQLGQAKVQDFGVAAIRDKDIRGFNVAVNDSFGVGGIERVGDFDAERKQSFQFHGTLGDAVLQRRAFQKLHGDEGLPVLLTEVMDRADVGMIQCGRGLRLTLESGEDMRVLGYIFRQELECDETVETGILSLVNDSHPAVTELL